MAFIAQLHVCSAVESCYNHRVLEFRVLMPIYQCSRFQKSEASPDLHTYIEQWQVKCGNVLWEGGSE